MKCQGQTQGFTGLCSSYSSRNADRQASLSLLQGIFLTPENLQKKMNLAFPWLLYSSMPKGKQLQEDVEKTSTNKQLIDQQCRCVRAQYLLANDVCLNKTDQKNLVDRERALSLLLQYYFMVGKLQPNEYALMHCVCSLAYLEYN